MGCANCKAASGDPDDRRKHSRKGASGRDQHGRGGGEVLTDDAFDAPLGFATAPTGLGAPIGEMQRRRRPARETQAQKTKREWEKESADKSPAPATKPPAVTSAPIVGSTPSSSEPSPQTIDSSEQEVSAPRSLPAPPPPVAAAGPGRVTDNVLEIAPRTAAGATDAEMTAMAMLRGQKLADAKTAAKPKGAATGATASRVAHGQVQRQFFFMDD